MALGSDEARAKHIEGQRLRGDLMRQLAVVRSLISD